MRNATISDTYNLGVKVNATVINNGTIYAATSSGMYKGNTDKNLSDKGNWDNYSGKVFTHLFHHDGNLIGLNNGEACTVDTGSDSWKVFYTPWFKNVEQFADRLVCHGGSHTYIIYSTNRRQDVPHKFTGIAYSPSDDTYWTGLDDGTLAQATITDKGEITNKVDGIKPDGPKYNHFGFMRHIGGKLYTAGGTGNPERPACVQVYDRSDGWHIYQDDFAPSLGYRYNGAYSLDVDPKDPNHVALGTQTGLYEFEAREADAQIQHGQQPSATRSHGVGRVSTQLHHGNKCEIRHRRTAVAHKQRGGKRVTIRLARRQVDIPPPLRTDEQKLRVLDVKHG